jgi:hypothetical protein
MRSAGDIKREILRLRDEKQIPYSRMEEDSRVSRRQILTALALEATEDVQRKLDAYLDAPHLHVFRKESALMFKFEDLDREMYRRYGLKNLHPLTFQKMSQRAKLRLLNAMHWRAKKALQDETEKQFGWRPLLPDSLNYWQCAEKVARRLRTVGPPKRHDRGVQGQNPVGRP